MLVPEDPELGMADLREKQAACPHRRQWKDRVPPDPENPAIILTM